MNESRIVYREESYRIIGACFEVYNEKGNGYLESVYQECLCKELGYQGIPFEAKRRLNLHYKGELLEQYYEPDFFCDNKIIVEIKAVKTLADEHRAQILNYLKSTGLRLGLLVNFGHFPELQHERFVT